jgi:hypothetical protein
LLALARLEPDQIKRLVWKWELAGKFPTALRNGGERKTITVPRELTAMAKALVARLGGKEAEALADLLGDAVRAQESPQP